MASEAAPSMSERPAETASVRRPALGAMPQADSPLATTETVEAEPESVNEQVIEDQAPPAAAANPRFGEADSQYAQEARSTRFQRPPEPDFTVSPPDRLEIRNNNIPLTIGLLFSVIASFMVFFVSLAGGTSGDDPYLTSFWRALSALAVLTTLSFVASWFMPAPTNRRLTLNKLDETDPFAVDFDGQPQPQPASDDFIKGGSVDVTLNDEPLEQFGYDDELDEDEEFTDLAEGAAHGGQPGRREDG